LKNKCKLNRRVEYFVAGSGKSSEQIKIPCRFINRLKLTSVIRCCLQKMKECREILFYCRQFFKHFRAADLSKNPVGGIKRNKCVDLPLAILNTIKTQSLFFVLKIRVYR
jgi:hypothetical protein